MRTRIYNKLNVKEIQGYLDSGGDTIFLPLGVIECHGPMPVDVETVFPQAVALLLAEKADGLVLTDLPYFYAGGTVISDATIHVTIRDGIDNLEKLCTSLIKQGFKKIFFVSGHGPACITIDAFCREFFEKTMIHPCHLETLHLMKLAFPQGLDMDILNSMMAGAYKIMGLEEYLIVDPNADESIYIAKPAEEPLVKFEKALEQFGGVAGKLFSTEREHSFGKIYKNIEERNKDLNQGTEYIQKLTDAVDIKELMDALDGYHAYVKNIVSRVPRLQKTFSGV